MFYESGLKDRRSHLNINGSMYEGIARMAGAMHRMHNTQGILAAKSARHMLTLGRDISEHVEANFDQWLKVFSDLHEQNIKEIAVIMFKSSGNSYSLGIPNSTLENLSLLFDIKVYELYMYTKAYQQVETMLQPFFFDEESSTSVGVSILHQILDIKRLLWVSKLQYPTTDCNVFIPPMTVTPRLRDLSIPDDTVLNQTSLVKLIILRKEVPIYDRGIMLTPRIPEGAKEEIMEWLRK